VEDWSVILLSRSQQPANGRPIFGALWEYDQDYRGGWDDLPTQDRQSIALFERLCMTSAERAIPGGLEPGAELAMISKFYAMFPEVLSPPIAQGECNAVAVETSRVEEWFKRINDALLIAPPKMEETGEKAAGEDHVKFVANWHSMFPYPAIRQCVQCGRVAPEGGFISYVEKGHPPAPLCSVECADLHYTEAHFNAR